MIINDTEKMKFGVSQTPETETNTEEAVSPDIPYEEYLYRLGNLKAECRINATWQDLAEIINKTYHLDHGESYYRKSYKSIKDKKMEEMMQNAETEIPEEKTVIDFFREVDKIRKRAKDERIGFAREMREASRRDELFDLFKDAILRYEPSTIDRRPRTVKPKAVYCLLSDLHYGAEFSNSVGSYSPAIARNRVMQYADEISVLGADNDCADCYVSLMGDMISGNIHTTTRIENRCDIVEQVIGASELVSEFLKELSENFNSVYINSVPGNHSRIDANMDNTLRGERLDTLVTYYCKTKLERFSNVYFVENEFDSTVGTFDIYGNCYACVHGDMDPDMRATAHRISRQLGKPLTGLMLGHLHVASYTSEDTVYIRNGSVCGSGDEYTMKKRLFGPAMQVAMIVDELGIQSYHPVQLY